MRLARDLAVLHGVEGALEVVDVAAADADRFEELAGTRGELERAVQRQVQPCRGAAHSDAAELLLDADGQRAGGDELEERAPGVASRDGRRGVDALAGTVALPTADRDAQRLAVLHA